MKGGVQVQLNVLSVLRCNVYVHVFTSAF